MSQRTTKRLPGVYVEMRQNPRNFHLDISNRSFGEGQRLSGDFLAVGLAVELAVGTSRWLELIGAAARIEGYSVCEDVKHELEVIRRHLKTRSNATGKKQTKWEEAGLS